MIGYPTDYFSPIIQDLKGTQKTHENNLATTKKITSYIIVSGAFLLIGAIFVVPTTFLLPIYATAFTVSLLLFIFQKHIQAFYIKQCLEPDFSLLQQTKQNITLCTQLQEIQTTNPQDSVYTVHEKRLDKELEIHQAIQKKLEARQNMISVIDYIENTQKNDDASHASFYDQLIKELSDPTTKEHKSVLALLDQYIEDTTDTAQKKSWKHCKKMYRLSTWISEETIQKERAQQQATIQTKLIDLQTQKANLTERSQSPNARTCVQNHIAKQQFQLETLLTADTGTA